MYCILYIYRNYTEVTEIVKRMIEHVGLAGFGLRTPHMEYIPTFWPHS